MSVVKIVFFISFYILLAIYSSYYILMLYFSKKNKKVKKKQIFPEVSIIIATFNEQNTIFHKLENTVKLSYPKEKLDILVIDSGSTDKTRITINDFIKNFKDDIKIRLLVQEKREGKASALNYALKHCIGEIIILTDADVLLDTDAISQIVSNFNDPRIGAVSGIEVMGNPDQSSITKMEQGYRSFYSTIRLGESNMDSVIMCESEFSAYRSELIENISEGSICDDMELTLQVRKKGFKTIYDPKVKFYEFTPFRLRSRIKHKIRRGQGIQQSILRHADIMFTRKYGIFSFLIFPFEFFMYILSPFLVPLCVISFFLTLIKSSNYLEFSLIGVILVFLILVILFIRIISSTESITLEKSKGSFNYLFITLPIDFLILQLCLLFSLISMLLGKSRYKWEIIEEIRNIKI